MAVSLRVLAMGEEALRDHQMETVLGTRHCDIEEAPLLLDLFRSASAEVRRNASINDIEHEDRLPFLALGGMNSREDQIILVEQRQAGLIAGRVRRIERQFCQETLPRRIPARNLFKLDQVGAPHQSVLMQPFEMRFVPPMGALEFSRPAAPSTAQVADHLDKCLPFLGRARREGASSSALIGSAAPIIWSSIPRADAGPMPGISCITRNPAMPSRGFSTKRSNARMSLICAVSRNFRPPHLTKGIFRRVSSTSSGPQ